MDIIKEMESTQAKFAEVQQEITNKQTLITNTQREILELDGALKQLQGEYKILIKFGQEKKLVDDDGKIIITENKK